jgi:hypothetical protein
MGELMEIPHDRTNVLIRLSPAFGSYWPLGERTWHHTGCRPYRPLSGLGHTQERGWDAGMVFLPTRFLSLPLLLLAYAFSEITYTVAF